ncbi:MAG: helix-turn-helix domain-containing protein [Nanoarchaeota archaeon]|nr:helix-turn-helix domain-containing protein [Nanoarchaeota archaeon]
MGNYQKRSGQNLQGIINDLKRRPEDAARELNVPLEKFNSYLRGEREIPAKVAKRATEIWPVNERDFYCLRDDAPNGIKIMRATESAQSSRVMERAGKPYYEYRDTAASSVSQFRPEWIKELCVVNNDEADNPEVQWNNGHFMHQFTYFVGPVNFYYQGEDGKKKIAVMNTGDSMYITPFVPHTFATRKNDAGESGLILALTYGNKLAGETQQELSALGTELASQYAMDFSTPMKAFGSLLRFHREAASMDYEELEWRTTLPVALLVRYESGNILPNRVDLESIAEALNIDARELLPPNKVGEKVIVKNYQDTFRWNCPSTHPAYKLVELAGTRHLPHSKALEMEVLKDAGSDVGSLDLKVGLHQYVYNVGKTPVNVNWYSAGQTHHDFIHPDDSLYLKPFVHHNFRGKDGKLLVLRIGGRAAGEPQRELSLIGKENADRAVSELMPWFNKEGKNKI